MTPTNSVVFPVYGQLFNFSGVVRSFTTGNALTGGLTGLSAQISKNDAAFVATTNTPVEIGTSGHCTLDLTAAEMSFEKLLVQVSASNSGAIYWEIQINPVVLSQFNGRYDAQSVLRLEQLLMDLYSGIGLNGASQTGAALQFMNPDGSAHFAGSVSQTATSAVRTLTQ